jgi:predicted nucleic acid-binding protein
LAFELRDPPSSELAAWLARGLGGPDAAYAALASALDIPLVTTDEELLRTAGTVAQRP